MKKNLLLAGEVECERARDCERSRETRSPHVSELSLCLKESTVSTSKETECSGSNSSHNYKVLT